MALRLDKEQAQADAWLANSQAQRDAVRYESMLAATKGQLDSAERTITWLQALLGERLGQRGAEGATLSPVPAAAH